ncbi:MAG: hypothetical protein ACE3JQ_00175 [Paenisporosarcina sp.]
MTAEIGILNKMGVALAADSAVTIGSEINQKVYNSANKLFSLSKYHPIGVMIYGGAEFMGVPWEIIIKSYRRKLNSSKFDTLKQYADDFINFITSNELFYNKKIEEQLVVSIFHKSFTEILSGAVTGKINDRLAQGAQVTNEEIEDFILFELNNKIELLRIKNVTIDSPNFLESLTTEYHTKINKIISTTMLFEVSENLKAQAMLYTGLLIQSETFSDAFSGLVISGYGEKEIFPSLYEFHLEGIFLEKLKYIERPKITIGTINDEDHITSSMRPFAQKEMVHSFMNGIEPSLYDTFMNVVSLAFSKYFEEITENMEIPSDIDLERVQKEHLETVMHSIHNTINSYQGKYFTGPIMDILDVLPKEELAAMAEALVNLTSFKRRVTMDAETVGGPIDVAVITKGDGFVWIKRKHYFKPELNYQFFKNYLEEE